LNLRPSGYECLRNHVRSIAPLRTCCSYAYSLEISRRTSRVRCPGVAEWPQSLHSQMRRHMPATANSSVGIRWVSGEADFEGLNLIPWCDDDNRCVYRVDARLHTAGVTGSIPVAPTIFQVLRTTSPVRHLSTEAWRKRAVLEPSALSRSAPRAHAC
jgi:hypothetical protein